MVEPTLLRGLATVPAVTAPNDDRIELQEAADRLGVHYQTAYRWVRTGRLPAQLIGGRYLIDAAALETVKQERWTPRRPTTPSRARLERQAQHVDQALRDGDEATVRAIARGLVDDGARLADLVQTLFVPPLRAIGEAWHNGDLPIWVEHRAAAIVERTLGELSPNPRGRRRGVAMVAAVSGDRHSLPTTMAAAVLRDVNWHVHHLSADMPGDELVRFCTDHAVDVAVISVTNPKVASLAAATAEQIRHAGTAAVVGGPGRSLDELVDVVAAAAGDRAGSGG
jgi:excisionase family DNA binding protein